MALQTMKLEIREGVARLTLERPNDANTVNLQFCEDLYEAALRCSEPDVRAVVLTGSGRFFSAGGDAKFFAGLGDALPRAVLELTGRLHSGLARLAQMNAPVIAAVNGPAAGAGLCFVAMADLAIAGRSAKFVVAFPGLGFSVDSGGTYFLPKILGNRRTLELALTGRTLDADEALAWGLVNQVVDDAEVVAVADRVAAKLAAGPTLAYGAIKRLVHAGWVEAMETHMEREARTLAEIVRTEDATEGVAAFAAKRPPRFRGR